MLDPVTIATMIRLEQERRYAEAERRIAHRATRAETPTPPRVTRRRASNSEA